MAVTSAKPVRDCGTTIPKPPWAYACSRHHHVKFGAEYDPAEWDAFFALDTSKCVPAMQISLEQAPATRLPSVWPGALMRKVSQVTGEASEGAQTRQYCPMSIGSKCRYCSADGPSHCCWMSHVSPCYFDPVVPVCPCLGNRGLGVLGSACMRGSEETQRAEHGRP